MITRKVEEQPTGLSRFGEFLDRVVAAVAPKRGLERAYARHVTLSVHRAASQERATSDWMNSTGSADADNLPELPLARQRCRELVANNGIASGAEQLFVDNVVGRGIRPQPDIRAENLVGIGKSQATEIEKTMKGLWDEWAPHADSQDRLNVYEIQQLIVRTNFHDGESFLLRQMVKDLNRTIEMAFEVIEADRVQTPTGKLAGSRDRYREGIRLGDRGQAIAYSILKHHPGDHGLGFTRAHNDSDYIDVLARDEFGRPIVLHPYLMKRPSQTHGFPWVSCVAADLHDIRSYLEAERLAKRVEACHAVFETRPDGVPQKNWNRQMGGEEGDRFVEPGRIVSLPEGADVKFFHPTRPGDAFEPYLIANYRQIGAGLGLSLLSVLRDYRQGNYSSARMALLGDRKLFTCITQWLVDHFCQPVYELLMEEAWAKELFGNNFDWFLNRRELLRTQWVSDGWEWIDPLKEVQAEAEAVALGVRSRTQICRQKGSEFEIVHKQLEREEEMRRDVGLGNEGVAAKVPVPVGGPDEPDDDDDDEED